MVEFDPEQRPMLGWKVGKTSDGQPIWESADRHDEYFQIRCGISGLRSDLPMLAVKSSRGLTDSCLLPPKEQKNSISLPELGEEQQEALRAAVAAAQQGTNTAAAAAAAAGDQQQGAAAASMDVDADVAQQQQQQGAMQQFAAAAASDVLDTSADVGTRHQINGNGSTAAAAAAVEPSPGSKRASSGAAAAADCADAAGWQSGPDKRRKVLVGSAHDSNSTPATAAVAADGVDRLARYEQHIQQQQQPELAKSAAGWSLLDAITQQSQQLATMSRSGRRKVWAQHRVMFLPLELVWLLPVKSAAWSQLQLIPNCIYRIDSMLQAVSMHQQLREMLHGGGRAAAAAVYNAPQMQAGDAAAGWERPAAMRDLLSELSHRLLVLDSGPDAGTTVAVAGGDEPAREDDSAAAPAAAAAAPAAGEASGTGTEQAVADGGGADGAAAAAAAAAPAGAYGATEANANGGDVVMTPADASSADGTAATTADTAAAAAQQSAQDTAAAATASRAMQLRSLDAGEGPGRWHHVLLPSPRLLLLSLTAASCHEAFDLERLEFLGDVVLKVLASCCMLKVRRWFGPE
jgi:hypothetical protein